MAEQNTDLYLDQNPLAPSAEYFVILLSQLWPDSLWIFTKSMSADWIQEQTYIAYGVLLT